MQPYSSSCTSAPWLKDALREGIYENLNTNVDSVLSVDVAFVKSCHITLLDGYYYIALLKI